jgi:hypothetical protein
MLLGGLLTLPAHAAQRSTFDHMTTGFELLGQHRDLPCESCHVNAIFKGTPQACANCHGVGTAIRATSKPANHILSTDQCDTCHTPSAWKPAVTFDHMQVRGSCASCHNGVQAQGEPPNHIPSGTGKTATPCEACHSATNFVNWLGATMNHAVVAALSCASCHETASYLGMHPSTNTTAGDSRPNATLDKSHPATGDCGSCHDTGSFLNSGLKPTNHIPTNAPCVQCHTTPGNYQLYSLTGVHQGVTGCLSCHGAGVNTMFKNIVPVTTPGNHIPIGSLDCNGAGCHTTANVNPGGFKIGAASISAPTLTVAGHATVAGKGGVSGCATCHETAPYLGMIVGTGTAAGDSRPGALDKNHPTTGDCNGCHTTAPTFSSNQTGGSKPANHIPTNAPCAQCHTTAGNYAAYVMGATGHAGITSNCALCHAYGLSFYNMAPPTLKEPPSGATGHIPGVPPNGTGAIACEACHSPSVFTTFAGTTMRHAYVTALKCESCHEYNMTWKTNAGLWTRPSPNHHAGQDCGGSGCHKACDTATTCGGGGGNAVHAHLAAAAAPLTRESGAASPGGPVRVAGSGPGATTVATQELTTAPLDHASVSRTPCVNCHNGQIATGKRSNHIATAAACDTCHTTNGWIPARFDHAAVVAHTCTTCHNAVRAIGAPRMHVPTTQQCDGCHGTLAWTPVRVDHRALASPCVSCHNNVAALGLSPGHLLTRIGCESCHSYPDWSQQHFRHVSAAFPGMHRATLACTSCHATNTEQVPYVSAADAGTCAACHARDFKPAAHPRTARGIPYGEHELANCSGACHVYTDTTQSTIARSLPGPHHRVTDATFRR